MHDIVHERFGISKKHAGFLEVIERVVNPREPRAHAALDDHDRARFVHVENRHAIDGTGGIRAGGGVRDVIGANDQV